MEIGFIGTGYIAKSVITGILGSKLKINKIFISKRNKKISNFLSKKSRKIVIINNNQEIINRSNWVFLSVTPKVGNSILKCLNFEVFDFYFEVLDLYVEVLDFYLRFWTYTPRQVL